MLSRCLNLASHDLSQVALYEPRHDIEIIRQPCHPSLIHQSLIFIMLLFLITHINVWGRLSLIIDQGIFLVETFDFLFDLGMGFVLLFFSFLVHFYHSLFTFLFLLITLYNLVFDLYLFFKFFYLNRLQFDITFCMKHLLLNKAHHRAETSLDHFSHLNGICDFQSL